MSRPKYQVFVSSTYEDLIEERKQIVEACLVMGHIPVGMEMFSAADEQQWEVITRTIDQCDYYVLIVAHRYGSMAGKISYTEKEYNYTVKKNIPVLAFVIDGKVSWPPNFMETAPDKSAALGKFKAKVKRKPIAFWESKEQLRTKFIEALGKAMLVHPRPGWVRTPETMEPDVATELSRLSKENADLRKEVEGLRQGMALQPEIVVLLLSEHSTAGQQPTILKKVRQSAATQQPENGEIAHLITFTICNVGEMRASHLQVDVYVPDGCTASEGPRQYRLLSGVPYKPRTAFVSTDGRRITITTDNLRLKASFSSDTISILFPAVGKEYELRWEAHADNMTKANGGTLKVYLPDN